MFWAFIMASLVIGNGLVASLIHLFSITTLFVIFSCFTVAAALFFFLLPKPTPQPSQDIELGKIQKADTEQNSAFNIVQVKKGDTEQNNEPI
jgi:hypothetical protein